MALITKAIKGTKDVLPQDAYKIQYIEATARETAADFGYKEIRTPVFEHTELFQRGVGDTTDVVQKEMYTFDDKGGRSITLRPEGTAGAARAFLENGLCNEALPQKVYYLVSCYRYEKPQAGRLREFHQFGVECFGTQSPLADAELIALASAFFDRLGVTGLRLEINSIGCPTCRAKYYDALRSYFAARKDELCDTCQSRLERNPMRILDCKSPVCQEIAKDAPAVTDYLCDECREHFDKVQSYLKAQNIDYTVNSRIVRGLDYYTRTVFELVADNGLVVAGGGRYDGLIEELGGAPQPGLGFAMGLERLLMLMEEQHCPLPEPPRCDLYLVSMGQAAAMRCFALATQLREGGVSVECDIVGRSLKAQMKYADKLGARYTAVIGDDELAAGRVRLRDMKTGEGIEAAIDDLYGALRDLTDGAAGKAPDGLFMQVAERP